MSLMNPIGIIGSFIYPFFFVDTDSTNSQIKTQVELMMFSFAIISAVWLVLSLFTFFENKNSPTTKSFTNKNKE